MPIPQVTDRLKEAPAMVLRTVFAGIGQLLMAADKLRAQLEEQFAPPAPPSPPAGQGEAGSQQPEAAGNVTLLSDRQGTAGQRPHTRPAGPAPAKAASSKLAATEPAATGKPAPAKPAPAKATTTKATKTKPAATTPAGAKPVTARATPAKATTPAGTKPATARATSAATTPAGTKPAAAKATATRPATAKPAAAKPATAKPAASTAPVPPIAGYDSLSVASLRARLRGLGPDGVRALLDYEQATARRDDVITMYERRLARLADETG